ncbi:facilitated trehalose transporter Tret1-like [Amyelois transitella]|uniref:facilitated trehalose transporter Tret1-like n=1 Tax=Amyelois transitella TaxID=680683 RepID=UPI0029900464|nr:facilitated trehalose transporter Tret1-like [Amyelois transitella]
MCDGVSYSLPGIINSVILSSNSTNDDDDDIRATTAEASHIAAIPGLGAFLGIFFISVLVQTIGRRLTYIFILTLDLISWSILPFARSVRAILIARFLRGLGDGLFYNGIMISEYADPKRRGYFSTIRKLFVGVGALVSHTMSIFMYTFREISIFAIVALLVAITLTFFWPESPAFSAFKGRYDECKRNFLWLHGNSSEKQDELVNMMGAQMIRIEMKKKKKNNKIETVLKTLIKNDFLKASLIVTILLMLLDLCGRHYYLAFINQVFLMFFDDISIAGYCSIISDMLTIVSLIISSFVIYHFKRRTLVFFFGFLTTTLMFIISLAGFVKVEHSGLYLPWLEPVVMLLLNVVVNMGVVPVNLILTVEMYPLEQRGIGLCVAGLNLVIFTYLFGLKLTPIMINNLGLHTTFGVFGVCIIICMVILYFILPETKDRTMQDIEDKIRNVDSTIIELRPMIMKKMTSDAH